MHLLNSSTPHTNKILNTDNNINNNNNISNCNNNNNNNEIISKSMGNKTESINLSDGKESQSIEISLPTPNYNVNSENNNNNNNKTISIINDEKNWKVKNKTPWIGSKIATIEALEFYNGLLFEGIDYYLDLTVMLNKYSDKNQKVTLSSSSIYKISSFFEDRIKGISYIELIKIYRPEETPGGRKPFHGQKELIPSKDSVVMNIENIKRLIHCTVQPLSEYSTRQQFPMNAFCCQDSSVDILLDYKAKNRLLYDNLDNNNINDSNENISNINLKNDEQESDGDIEEIQEDQLEEVEKQMKIDSQRKLEKQKKTAAETNSEPEPEEEVITYFKSSQKKRKDIDKIYDNVWNTPPQSDDDDDNNSDNIDKKKKETTPSKKHVEIPEENARNIKRLKKLSESGIQAIDNDISTHNSQIVTNEAIKKLLKEKQRKEKNSPIKTISPVKSGGNVNDSPFKNYNNSPYKNNSGSSTSASAAATPKKTSSNSNTPSKSRLKKLKDIQDIDEDDEFEEYNSTTIPRNSITSIDDDEEDDDEAIKILNFDKDIYSQDDSEKYFKSSQDHKSIMKSAPIVIEDNKENELEDEVEDNNVIILGWHDTQMPNTNTTTTPTITSNNNNNLDDGSGFENVGGNDDDDSFYEHHSSNFINLDLKRYDNDNNQKITNFFQPVPKSSKSSKSTTSASTILPRLMSQEEIDRIRKNKEWNDMTASSPKKRILQFENISPTQLKKPNDPGARAHLFQMFDNDRNNGKNKINSYFEKSNNNNNNMNNNKNHQDYNSSIGSGITDVDMENEEEDVQPIKTVVSLNDDEEQDENDFDINRKNKINSYMEKYNNSNKNNNNNIKKKSKKDEVKPTRRAVLQFEGDEFKEFLDSIENDTNNAENNNNNSTEISSGSDNERRVDNDSDENNNNRPKETKTRTRKKRTSERERDEREREREEADSEKLRKVRRARKLLNIDKNKRPNTNYFIDGEKSDDEKQDEEYEFDDFVVGSASDIDESSEEDPDDYTPVREKKKKDKVKDRNRLFKSNSGDEHSEVEEEQDSILFEPKHKSSSSQRSSQRSSSSQKEPIVDESEKIKEDVFKVFKIKKTIRESFDIFIQYIISCIIDQKFSTDVIEDQDEYFIDAVKRIQTLVVGRKEALVLSNMWHDEYLHDITHRPFFHSLEIDNMTGKKCKSCNKTKHNATILIYLSGRSYAVEDFWKGYFENPKRLKGTSKEEPASIEYELGSFCFKRSQLFHQLHHYPYKMFRDIKQDVRVLQQEHPNWPNSDLLLYMLNPKHGFIPNYFITLENMLDEADRLSKLSITGTS